MLKYVSHILLRPSWLSNQMIYFDIFRYPDDLRNIVQQCATSGHAWCLVHLKIIWRKINLFPQGYVLVHTAQPPPFKRFWKNICFGLELRRNYDTYNLSIGVHVVQHVINHYYTTISTNINTNMPHANVNMSNECSVSSYTQENCFSYMFRQ